MFYVCNTGFFKRTNQYFIINMSEFEESQFNNFTPTSRESFGSIGMSYSSASSSISLSSSSVSLKTALNECSQAWISYLNVLNKICVAGKRLSIAIATLEQCGYGGDSKIKGTQNHTILNLINSWNDLGRYKYLCIPLESEYFP